MTVFPQLIFGYHGCEREVAERAMDWAVRHCKNPAVLGAVIGFGNCMNLMDVDSQVLLQQTYQAFKARQVQLPVNSKSCHDLDCSVVNSTCEYLASQGHVFDTVRGAFPEGDPVFDESQILTKTHVQICVRNLESIVAYFLPYATTAGRAA